MDLNRKTMLARSLLEQLIAEFREHSHGLLAGVEQVASDKDAAFEETWSCVRAMMNVRPPWKPTADFLLAQDELLPALIEEKGIRTVADSIPSPANPQIRLWRGDITTLAVDAIVNAANSGMTGCWQPLHYCIDNAIHTFAGVQLRIETASQMEEQGHGEPTGNARITRAYNLPAKHVIHTVGPIAGGSSTDEHRRQLEQCYISCLDLARKQDLLSIALCCISTGVFGFPRQEAAEIAVSAVSRWLEGHPDSALLVVFNVFGETDERIYSELLGIA